MAYLLEVAICWAVFYGVYHLLLRAETFHCWNRWYLLTTVMLGLALPVLDIDLATAEQSPAYLLQPITVGVQELEAIVVTASTQDQAIDFQLVACWVYWLGAMVSLWRLGYGLWQIRRLYCNGEIVKQNSYDLVTTNAPHLPFSFFNNLFWSKNFEVTEEERRSIVRHEEAHIFQRHSHDVVLLELVAAFTWCVPFVYFYKKALKTTHEYLADAHVTAGFDKKQYGRLLLRQSHPGMQVAISNSLFSSQLKKRIVMMTKTSSPQQAGWKYLAVLPALTVLLMAFSFENNPLPTASDILSGRSLDLLTENLPAPMALDTVPATKADGEAVFSTPEVAPRFPGCEGIANFSERTNCAQQQLFDFISENIKYPAKAKEIGIEGTVFVRFIVEKDGTIADADIAKGIGGGCDEEVLRLMYLMPKWVPGTQQGIPVKTSFMLPVKFKLDAEPITIEAVKPLTLNDLDESPVMLGCENLTGEERQKCSNGKLMQAVYTNIKYPAEARIKGVEGTVYAKFIIQEDGSVANPEIVRGVGGSCDEEVLRVVKELQWSPGKKDGHAMPVAYTLPVKFKLDEGSLEKNVTLEVYPNPAPSDGFEVRFKAPASKITLFIADANGRNIEKEMTFPDYSGELYTIPISVKTLFGKEAAPGPLFISLVGANGNVLATTKVIVQ